MPWVRLDDGFSDHPKVVGLSDSAFRTHVSALCYCNRHLTDGHVPAVIGNSCVDELVDAGLWSMNGSGYVIHDYLEFQPSRASVLEERAKAAERMRKHRSGEVRANTKRTSSEVQLPRTRSRTQDRKPNPKPEVHEANASLRRQVYDFWRQERKRTRSSYDTISDGRRKKIDARLKEFSVEELCEAIRGVANDPWEERDQHDDLTVIFRSKEQVERFLGFAASPGGAYMQEKPYERARGWVETVGWQYPDDDLAEELGRRGMEGDEKRKLMELAYSKQEEQDARIAAAGS